MKKSSFIALSALPYSFLVMFLDEKYRIFFPYILIALAIIFLIAKARKYNGFSPLILGSIISLGLSQGLIYFFKNDGWSFYFKPFSPYGMGLFWSLLIIIIEFICWFFYLLRRRNYENKKRNKTL